MPTTIDATPRFTSADAMRLGREFFGLNAAASPLPSERDQNFALKTAAGEIFVLKIAKSDEDPAVLELQNAALKHLAQSTSSLALPRSVPALKGADIMKASDASGREFLVRLMTWLDGEIFVHALPHSESLLASCGSALAELDLQLRDFSHPAMRRELHWDLQHADLALKHLSLLSAAQQTVVRRFMDGWATVDWKGLRHGVIHGDANDYNVLVKDGKVAGFLDFGDLVHSAVICDLAIALAYAMLGKTDPLQAAVTMVRAYHARLPLTANEVDALYTLITARLCMSLCYAAYNARAKSGDAYQLVTAGPAWELLQQLAGMSEGAVRKALRNACGLS